MPSDVPAPGADTRRAFVVLNPVGGRTNPEATRKALGRHLAGAGWRYDLYETTGNDDVPALVREAVADGAKLAVAIGGDGTVSAVANGVVGPDVSLGIVPTGTGNVLARQLSIPVDVERACSLICGRHMVRLIDTMRVGDRHFVLDLSVGLTAVAMRETAEESKHRFGIVAYFLTGLRNLAGLEPRRYQLTIDGVTLRPRASEVIIANGMLPLKATDHLTGEQALSDGKMGVYIVRTRTLAGYVTIVVDLLLGHERRNPRVRYFEASNTVRIVATPAQGVQADGDAAGETPVEVHMVPHSVGIIVPVAVAPATIPWLWGTGTGSPAIGAR